MSKRQGLVDLIKRGDIEEALDVIKSEAYNIQELDTKNGYSVLHHAIDLGDEDLVQALFNVRNKDLLPDLTVTDKKKHVRVFNMMKIG